MGQMESLNEHQYHKSTDSIRVCYRLIYAINNSLTDVHVKESAYFTVGSRETMLSSYTIQYFISTPQGGFSVLILLNTCKLHNILYL